MQHLNLPVTQIGCDKKIMDTRRQLNEVMDVMRSNIEKVSERSERLETLANRAQMLDMSTQEFHRCSVQVHRKQYWKANLAKFTALAMGAAAIISTIGYFAI